LGSKVRAAIIASIHRRITIIRIANANAGRGFVIRCYCRPTFQGRKTNKSRENQLRLVEIYFQPYTPLFIFLLGWCALMRFASCHTHWTTHGHFFQSRQLCCAGRKQ
jgi:hypothetical protein